MSLAIYPHISRCAGLALLGLCLLWPWPLLGQEESSDPPAELSESSCKDASGKLLAVSLEGCTVERCGVPEIQERLLSLSDLRKGEFVDGFMVERARLRLLKTQFVAALRTECVLGEGTISVRLIAKPQLFVSGVSVEGNEVLYQSEIRKRLLIEPGTPLTPGTPEAEERVSNQVETLERLYRDAGFDEPQIYVDVRKEDSSDVAVGIRIREGVRQIITDVEITRELEWMGEGEDAGCPLPDSSGILEASGLGVGSVYTHRIARDARSRIRRYLQSRGYARTKVQVGYESRTVQEGTDSKGILKVFITYEGCHQILIESRSFEQDPYRPAEEELLDILPFGESGSFDWDEAFYGRELLSQYLQGQGFLFADVELDYRPARWVTPELQDPAMRGVIRYRITLGALTEIRDVKIEGIPEEIRAEVDQIMTTRPYDFFGQGGYLQIPRVLADLERVAQFLRDRGYLGLRYEDADGSEQVKIERRPERTAEVFLVRYRDVAFRIRRPAGESYIYLSAKIIPGKTARVRKISIYGAQVLASNLLLKRIPLKTRQKFVRETVAQAVRQIKKEYQQRGYHQTQVRAECSSPDRVEVGRVSCLLWNLDVESVTVHIDIKEGSQLVVGEILWFGNLRTQDRFVERDMPKGGEPFDAEKIQESLRKVRKLGVFSSVRAVYVGLDESPPRRRVGLVVQLQEIEPRFVDLSVGLETISRAEDVNASEFVSKSVGNTVALADTAGNSQIAYTPLRLPDLLIVSELAYIDTNFLGRAEEIQLPIKYGLSTTQFNRFASFTPSWLDKRLFGTELQLRITPFVVYDRAFQALDVFEYGVESEVSHQMFENLIVAFQYELSRITVRDPSVSDTFSPFSLQNKARPQFVLDYLDSPIHPMKGEYLAASIAYINALEEGQALNFVKTDIRYKTFNNIHRTLIMGMMLRFGYSQSFEGERLPDNERFVLGGNKGVRGYDDDGIVQYRRNGDIRAETNEQGEVGRVFGGDLVATGTLEMRFPVLRASGFWGSLFYDVGALSEGLFDLHGKSFRQSAGFGFRYLIGNAIPVRLDYGIKLDRRCAELDTEGACTARETFGNLHFGILYTF